MSQQDFATSKWKNIATSCEFCLFFDEFELIMRMIEECLGIVLS